MRIRAILAAVFDLKSAERELRTADRTATTDTDPAWAAANRAVAKAEQNPDLPRRYFDPADRL